MRNSCRKLLSLLAVIVCLSFLTVCFTAGAEEKSIHPVNWNLTDIFESDEAWYAAYDEFMADIPTWERFRGTLNTADGILAMLEETCISERVATYNKLYIYASFKESLNATDPVASDMSARLTYMYNKVSEALAFMEPEIFELSLEERRAIFADPRLVPYAYSNRNYIDEKAVHYSEETNVALSKAEQAQGLAYDTFTTFLYSEQPYPTVTLSDGTALRADEANYVLVINGKYSEEDKKLIADAFYSAAVPFRNTYASLLYTNTLEEISTAQLNNFDSALAYQLYTNDIDPEIYTMIKETVYAMLPAYQQYLADLKEYLGLEHLYYFDTIASVDTFTKSYTFDEGCEEMFSALAILGEDYIENARTLVDQGHIDVYPTAGKTTGGFENSTGLSSIYPYILLNYTDDFESVATLCHEMGHAMYERFASIGGKTNLDNVSPSIFTHEVASTNNEFLLNLYELSRAQTDEEKLFYTRNMMVLISGTIIRQIMYSEFEEYIYSVVEGGGSLDADSLNAKWMELNRTYYGDVMEYPEGYETRWCVIPHFYYGFYVYKYATSCTYAAITSNHIFNGTEGALEAYREFLTLGRTNSPAELLRTAGVDPLNRETYTDIVTFFTALAEDIRTLQTGLRAK